MVNHIHIITGFLFVTHDGGALIFRHLVPDLEFTAPIVISNNVFIGARSILMPGITVGNNCIIGAGSVVTKDVLDNSVVAGAPARKIKTTAEYMEALKNKSLKIGHMKGREKDLELRKILGYKK